MTKTGETKQPWSPDSKARYTRRRIERADAGNQPTLIEFAQWLKDSQELSPTTIHDRIISTSIFVDTVTAGAKSCERAFRSITVQQIEEFFVGYGKDRGIGSRGSMNTAMRSFLEFAACRGWVNREMRDCVPSLSSYRLSDVPRRISDEQLSKLLTTPWTGCQCLRRDRAIVLLLAIYGVRREQVSALQLTDIDWHERKIVFAAHKGGKAIHHVLVESVAEALGEYLSKDRQTSDCDYVFLRQRRPHVRLSPEAISALVAARTRRCGGPPRRPHAFRHAFATRLLRASQPVKAIADLLGHRSLDAVSIYAKVDFARLTEAAVEWPEVTS